MKKILNKKGFTLVELLAVIVVLGFVMLIVANRVGDAMKQSRGDSLLLQVKSIEREIDKTCIIDNKITKRDIRALLDESELEFLEGEPVEDATSFKAQAKEGTKFANIKMPKNSSGVIETGSEGAPIITINTSCPIKTGGSSDI